MENLTTTQKIFLVALGIIVVIILVVYVFTKENSTTYFEDEVVNELSVNNATKAEIKNNIIIHIAGEVENEGIIELPPNSRIYDAVEAAGGLTAEANLSQINLANMLKDGQKIYIPNEEETEEYIEEVTGKNEYKEVGKIDINTATQTELETLSGIGPSTALKIVNYRKENGEFSNIEDLKNVPGIGEAKFNNIKDSITVN